MKKTNDLNKVLANNITETMTNGRLTYCPNCNSKLQTTGNYYAGVPCLTVTYCPKCQWHPNHN